MYYLSPLYPFFDMILGLEGFEAIGFWFMLAVVYLITGLILDYLMKGLSYGALINGALALAGALGAVYLRYSYFMVAPWFFYEPFVTTGLVCGCVTLTVVLAAALRGRIV